MRHQWRKLLSGAGIRDWLTEKPNYGSGVSNRIRFVGHRSAVADTVALPAGWLPGDLALVFAYRLSTAATPSLPGTFTDISNGASNTNGHRAGFRVLQAGDTTIGTWTNAQYVSVLVLRNASVVDPIGGVATQTGTVNNVVFPALTMADTDGRSWVWIAAGQRTALDMHQFDISGAVNLVPVWGRLAAHYLPRVSSFSAQQFAAGTSVAWRSVSVEIRAI